MKTKDLLIDCTLAIVFIIAMSLLYEAYAQEAAPVSCGENSHAEVDACTIDDKLGFLLVRKNSNLSFKPLELYNAVDECVPVADDPLTTEIDETFECPVWVDPKINAYTFEEYDDQNPKDLYDRLIMVGKYSTVELTTELDLWRAEVKAEIDWKARVEVQRDEKLRFKMDKCSFNVPNAQAFLNKIIKDKDLIKLECLESKQASVNADIAAAKAKEDNRKAAKDRMKVANCDQLGNSILKDMCELLK